MRQSQQKKRSLFQTIKNTIYIRIYRLNDRSKHSNKQKFEEEFEFIL